MRKPCRSSHYEETDKCGYQAFKFKVHTAPPGCNESTDVLIHTHTHTYTQSLSHSWMTKGQSALGRSDDQVEGQAMENCNRGKGSTTASSTPCTHPHAHAHIY